MKIEDAERQGVENDQVNWVLLQGGAEFDCEPGTFGIHSPAQADPRRGQRAGAFIRFKPERSACWVEGPLGSLVAVGYPDPPVTE